MRSLWLIMIISSACILPDASNVDPSLATCYKTNYQGPVTDLYGGLYPDDINFTYTISNFGLNWTQSGTPIKEISFKSSDNLDFFRVVITLNNGNTITTRAIGPNDHSTAVSGANNVKRVDFYVSPVDFTRNVTLTDINLKACTGNGICSFFNSVVQDLILTALLGILSPGSTSGTFSASVAPNYPFIEFNGCCIQNLSCSGGSSNFSFEGIAFFGPHDIEYMVVAVWSGADVVPIVDSNGVVNSTFSTSKEIYFGTSVVGDRIRTVLIPPKDSNQGISGFVLYRLFFPYLRNLNPVPGK